MMNFFQRTGDFFSFVACRLRPYCLRDETICDPDIVVNFESLGDENEISNQIRPH